jgi:RNA polymerase sigma factor (sigma-70 family)
MTRPEPAAAPESLLAQTEWMRRLARSLVRDDAQADDLVQDAMAAALRSPPRDPLALPAWLATSIKNGARQLWRGEGRRAVREEAASRPEPQPSAAEVVARAEEHGLVVRAVLALEEPYRTTLLLRFYDDLPPREVAKRTDVPVETARARVRRGVDQLRSKLDAAHGGDGTAWRLALAPFLFHKAAATVGAGAGAATSTQPMTTGAMVMAGTGTTAVVGGAALALGLAAGWWVAKGKADENAATLQASIDEGTTRLESFQSEAAGRDDRARRQAQEAEAKLRVSQKEVQDLKQALEETKAALAEAKAAPKPKVEAPAAAPAPRGPRFEFGQYAKLGEVDWKSVGENLGAMAPLCDAIMKKFKAGDEFPGDEIGKLQQHNGPLVAAAVKVMKTVPGTGANGSFTHPAFMSNAIAATLEASGKPLDAAQATALEKIGREYSDEDARRLEGYPADAFALRKISDEADLRRRFFDAAFAALSQEQRDTLTPPTTKGVLGFDLFSDGLLWATVMKPLAFKEKDDAALVTQVAGVLNSGVKIPQDRQDAARGVIAKWAQGLPAGLVTADEEEGGGNNPPLADVRAAAEQTLGLLRRLVEDLKLEDAQAANVRRWPVVLMPRAKKAD